MCCYATAVMLVCCYATVLGVEIQNLKIQESEFMNSEAKLNAKKISRSQESH